MLKYIFSVLKVRGNDVGNVNQEYSDTNALTTGEDSASLSNFPKMATDNESQPHENEESASKLPADDIELTEEDSENGKRKISNLKKTRLQSQDCLTLDCSVHINDEDVIDSPESDGDILGILDYSPDVLEHSRSSGLKFTPYNRVFESLRFSELMPHVFIRNQQISVRIIDMDILPSTLNIFNQCVFTIILQHGSTHWTIKRRSRQISSLHSQLRLFKTMLKLPAATSEERERRQSMREQMRSTIEESSRSIEGLRIKSKRLVKFPRRSIQRMDQCTTLDVEVYLSNLLHHSLLKGHSAVLEFFEISPISFVRHLGPKLKEGFVKKRSGGRSALACCGGQYKSRWFVIRETFVFCIAPGKGLIRTVMLIDDGFQVSHGFRHTRITKGLFITNNSRSLVLKCDGEESEKEWNEAIEHICKVYASDFTAENRYLSFAPVRENSYSRWYVDGACFMSDVADLLQLAQEEIFITDWWLSPDIYMKRPDLTGSYWKLSEILKRKASKGVKIFILLYKEVELALGLNSLYSKRNLCQLSPNIKVLRHPDHYKGSLYWAHHEKMVVVDQMHAFVGGIDLCYGRWDDYRHKLVDVGHAGVIPQKAPESTLGRLILNTHDLLLNNVSKFSPEKVNMENKAVIDSIPVIQEAEVTEHEEETLIKEEENSLEASAKNSLLCDKDENTCKLVESNLRSLNKENVKLVTDSSSRSSSISSSSSSNDETFPSCANPVVLDDIVDKDLKYIPDVIAGIPPIKYDDSSESERLVDKKGVAVSHSKRSSSSGDDSDDSSQSSDESASEFRNERRKLKDGVVLRKKGRDRDSELEANYSNMAENREILSKSDQHKSQFRVKKNLKAVKNLGIDLVEEMKEKKKEMKYWTEKKVPRLKRSSSFDSEMGLSHCSEMDEEEKVIKIEGKSKRLRRRLKRRVKSKGRLSRLSKESRVSSTGSLIDLHKEVAHEEVTSVHLWLGKDYVNWITKDLYDPQIPFNDNVNRHQTPRMPWHDISLYVEGPAARDAARHFILRWNAVKSEKMKNNERYPYLIPRTYKPSSFVPSVLQLKHRVKCQVVRSLGNWSGDVNTIERSIYNAYLDAIKNSKHYIYIENQFFISSASIGRNEVVNNIAYHLFERILEAHRNKQTFRVYIVLPLLPAFEGQIGTPSGIAMQYILHYSYQSIIRGPNSLIGMLMKANVTWQHYLSFCSLRTHDVLEGQLVSELIYVHSKLLIVDDRLVIAGSANINDRSLLGNRDSEVDLVIEDEEFTKGKMNGQDFMRGEFAGSLRTYLFSEHLGVFEGSAIDVSDPTCENFFVRTWQAFASKNTKIYDDVFSCIPCDAATSFIELKRIRSEKSLAKKNPEKAKEMLKKLQGRLVMYPLMFLKDEILKPRPISKEFLLPVEMWV